MIKQAQVRSTKPVGKRGSLLLLCISAASLAACDNSSEADSSNRDDAVNVGYIVAQATSVQQPNTYSGRAVAFQSAEVRPQVSGVIRKRLFAEGQLVHAGDPLYQIDPSLYGAAVNQARANQMGALADKSAADELVERYRPLAEMEAVSRQDLVNAVAAARRANAAVAQTTAALETARINQRFTTVPAPLTGRIGRSLVTVGGLAATNQPEPLATIQQLDPIFVDVQQSAADLVALRESIARDVAKPTATQASISLPNGSTYSYKGTVAFSEVVADPSGGTVTMRIRVPNPDGLLIPGMFVRATLAQSFQRAAFLIPQQAVMRDPTGKASIWVVGPRNRAVRRGITVSRTQGDDWVVTQGVHSGDKVITQGIGPLRANTPIRPVDAHAPIRAQAGEPERGTSGQ